MIDTIGRYSDGIVLAEKLEEIKEVLSAAKSPKKDGKGNPYIDLVNQVVPLFESKRTGSKKTFQAFGY